MVLGLYNKCIKFTNQSENAKAKTSLQTDDFGNFLNVIYKNIWSFDKSLMEITFNNGSFYKKDELTRLDWKL